MENSALILLVLTAFGLLITLTGGIAYLTFAEWRDRRRLDQEKRSRRSRRR